MNASPTVRQSRLLDATCEQVWDAWTQPAAMLQWFSPLGMMTAEATTDLRVGGRYRIVMKQGEETLPTPPPFGNVLVAEGVYEKLEPPHLLVFTWSWVGWNEVSRVRVELKESGDQTELLLVHTQLTSEESREFHDTGWRATVESLVVFLDRFPPRHDHPAERIETSDS